jgi:outer membrane biosynthesis protein TonB
VRAVRVLKGAGHGLDQAATKAMWRYRFAPGRGHDGNPVDVELTYKVHFNQGR